MDQQYLEREKELFKLNAKLNAKTKKFISNKCVQVKTVQITTSNSNFNFYHHEEINPPVTHTEEHSSLEISCKKITIANPPLKKQNDISYPLYNRSSTAFSKVKKPNIDIRIPDTHTKDQDDIESLRLKSNASQDNLIDFKTDITENSFKSESMLVRYASESSIPVNTINHTHVIPKVLDKPNVSSEGLIKFLKSKVAILQTELETGKNFQESLQKENLKHIKKVKKLITQQDISTTKTSLLDNLVKSLKEKCENMESTLKDKEKLNSELNSQLISIKEDLRQTCHSNQVNEKRCLKTHEDLEACQKKLESYKDIEKILRESAKQEQIEAEEKFRQVKIGRMNLLKSYKQQVIMIDNLRRQNICLQKAKMIEITEKEFLKVLDWNFDEKRSS